MFLELGETPHHAAVVCKLAKIWFIMQCTLSQINAVSTFFLKDFFHTTFSSRLEGVFAVL